MHLCGITLYSDSQNLGRAFVAFRDAVVFQAKLMPRDDLSLIFWLYLKRAAAGRGHLLGSSGP